MKHRLIAFALCLVMLVAALVGCTTYDTNTVRANRVRATAYVYTPDGKLIVNGNCNGYQLGSDGFIVVTIDGVRYKTHTSNVTIIETDG